MKGIGLADSWVVPRAADWPADDQLSVRLAAPTDAYRVSAYPEIRVANI